MRMLVALLCVACSSPGQEGPPVADAGTDAADSAMELGEPSFDVAAELTQPSCWENCAVSRPNITGGCNGLGPGDCNESAAGWFGSVPGCGESALYLSKCVWNPSGGCINGPFYESMQVCVP